MQPEPLTFYGFPAEIWLSIATIIAVIAGPVLAVLVTRWVDDRRAHKQRQWEIFRTLMRTRRVQLSGDFVGAINLVEVEFSKYKDVIHKARTFLSTFNQEPPRDEESWRRWEMDRDLRLTQLLDSIAKALKTNIEQVDIFSGGYAPRGWQDVEREQQLTRQLLIQTLRGERALPVISVPSEVERQAETPHTRSTEQDGRAANVVEARRREPDSK